jgi:hypothetical protein
MRHETHSVTDGWHCPADVCARAARSAMSRGCGAPASRCAGTGQDPWRHAIGRLTIGV